MLSTPTANTRNGTTSIVNKVVVMPKYPQMPTEHTTEQRTMTIPPTPRRTLLSNYKQPCDYISSIAVEYSELPREICMI